MRQQLLNFQTAISTYFTMNRQQLNLWSRTLLFFAIFLQIIVYPTSRRCRHKPRVLIGRDTSSWTRRGGGICRLSFHCKGDATMSEIGLTKATLEDEFSQLQRRLLTVIPPFLTIEPGEVRLLDSCREDSFGSLQTIVDRLFMSVENVCWELSLCLSLHVFSIRNEGKFLWENLPGAMKSDKEFQLLASIVSLLSLKHYGEFYHLCQTAFGQRVVVSIVPGDHGTHSTFNQFVLAEDRAKEKFVCLARVTIENVRLIELAYKSISFDDLEKVFGLNRRMLEQICLERQWQIESDGIHLLPHRHGSFFSRFSSKGNSFLFFSAHLSSTSNSNLAKLAELVCFFERWDGK